MHSNTTEYALLVLYTEQILTHYPSSVATADCCHQITIEPSPLGSTQMADDRMVHPGTKIGAGSN